MSVKITAAEREALFEQIHAGLSGIDEVWLRRAEERREVEERERGQIKLREARTEQLLEACRRVLGQLHGEDRVQQDGGSARES